MSEVKQAAETPTKRMDRYRGAINVLSNWIGFGFAAVVHFFLSPMVVSYLGNTGYGVWVLAATLTGYLGLLDLGVRGAASRYVAKLHTQGDHQSASRVVSSSLSIFLIGGAIAIALSAVLAFGVIGVFHIPVEFQHQARIVVLLTGVTIAVSLVSGVFGGVLTGLQRFDIANAIEMVGVALRAVAFVIALKAGEGLIALAVLNLAMSVLTGLANLAASLHLYPELKIRIAQSDRETLRMIFSFSAYLFLLLVANRIIFFADAIVIGLYLPVSAITFFAIASNLINYGRTLLSGIWTTTTPLASSMEARGAEEKLGQMLLSRSRFASLLMLPIGITFLLRGKSFIGLWMGPAYAEPSGLVLQILTLYLIVSSGNLIANATMLGISKHKAVAPIALGEAVCNLALSVALIRPYGIYGVAWGTTLPSLLVSVLFWPWYVRKTLQIPVRSYALAVWGRPIVAAAPYALLTFLVEKYWAASNLLLFFVQVTIVLPMALAGFWYVCFTRTERQEYAAHYLQPMKKALRLA